MEATAKLKEMQAEVMKDSTALDLELVEENSRAKNRLQARLDNKAKKTAPGQPSGSNTNEKVDDSPVEPLAAGTVVDTISHDKLVETMLEESEKHRAREAQEAAQESSSKHAQLMARLEARKKIRLNTNDNDAQSLSKKLQEVEAKKLALRQAEENLAKQAQMSAMEALAAESAYTNFTAKRNHAVESTPISFEKALQELVAHEDVECTLEQIQIVEAFSKVLEKKYKERQNAVSTKKKSNKVIADS
ncbi:hypothetical protein THRCLA_21673 [Thraustotheca clavata]|uniref:Uncharacterized protein n=1 Tax=Thraustotheca clavata TaxID=74557 RepID=A0A1V9ZRJ1_9STRA|nr:hypothetical protein THRCLA_21673 [Thraustotheca clavata]